MLGFIRGGLQDFSISREGATWGIPFPIAENGETRRSARTGPGTREAGTIYVWYDALINYITGAGFPDDLDVVPAVVAGGPPRHRQGHRPLPHDLLARDAVVGRDRRAETRLGPRLPDRPGRADEQEPRQLPGPAVRWSTAFGADGARYVTLREVPFDRDTEVSWDSFVRRYNADLANDFGNLVNRTISMVNRYLGGERPLPRAAGASPLAEGWADTLRLYRERLDGYLLHDALAELWEFVRGREQDRRRRAALDAEQAGEGRRRRGRRAAARRAGRPRRGVPAGRAGGGAVHARSMAPRILAQLGYAYPYAADGNGGPPSSSCSAGARRGEPGRVTDTPVAAVPRVSRPRLSKPRRPDPSVRWATPTSAGGPEPWPRARSRHVEFPADDPERAKRFYAAVAGWEFGEQPEGFPGYFLFRTGERPGGGHRASAARRVGSRRSASTSPSTRWRTGRAAAEANGGTVSRAPTDIGSGHGPVRRRARHEGTEVGLWREPPRMPPDRLTRTARPHAPVPSGHAPRRFPRASQRGPLRRTTSSSSWARPGWRASSGSCVPGWNVRVLGARAGARRALAVARRRGRRPSARRGEGGRAPAGRAIEAWARDERVVAIGETGLDSDRMFSPWDAQLDNLRRNLALALATGKPAILHCRSRAGARDAQDALVEELRAAGFDGRRRPARRSATGPAIIHSFSGPVDYCAVRSSMGLAVSFSGWCSGAGRGALRRGRGAVPAARLLVETDAPFLSPPGAPRRATSPRTWRSPRAGSPTGAAWGGGGRPGRRAGRRLRRHVPARPAPLIAASSGRR